jgi:hypothetical protein
MAFDTDRTGWILDESVQRRRRLLVLASLSNSETSRYHEVSNSNYT